ncbi:MAG: hypothetical protein HC800_20425 [Phormidesmis sp. RL_2_1]|nr:hypothetical protein [Phormidesmis sp. RL_2_1]
MAPTLSNRGKNQPVPGAKNFSRWMVVVLTLLLTLALTIGAIALLYNTHIDGQQRTEFAAQQQQQQIEKLSWFKLNEAETALVNHHHLDCIQILAEVPETYSLYPRIEYLQEECYTPLASGWLAEAKKLAREGHLKDAIAQASKISGGHLQAQAQHYIQDWSQQMLDLASKSYGGETHDEFQEAITIARAVPQNSPLYETSQNLLKQWQQEWSDNERYATMAQKAFDQGDIQAAVRAAQSISLHPAWVTQRNHWLIRANDTEQAFEKIVQQANSLFDQEKFSQAAQVIRQLPDADPWHLKKTELLTQIEAQHQSHDWSSVVIPIIGALVVGVMVKRIF